MDILQSVIVSGLASAFVLAVLQSVFARWMTTLINIILLPIIGALLLWGLGVTGTELVVATLGSCMTSTLCDTLTRYFNK
jgi:fructose-specific phosphotransferase system IIC component